MDNIKSKNDAEHLVKMKDGKRYFNDKPLANATMVWQCTIEGCATPPKPQRRGQYENKLKCNACSNREKSKNPELLIKRGQAISKSIKELGDKWSKVAILNMSDKETTDKISKSMKQYIAVNEEAISIRRDTALKNNKITGFGTSEFSKNVWESYSEEERELIGHSISDSLLKTGEKEHLEFVNKRYPNFKVISYGYPDSIYECPNGHLFPMRGNNFLKRGICTVCSPRSKIELEMYKWFLTLCPHAKQNKRVLYLDESKNGNMALEIDVFDDQNRFGIEVHGLYVHQETIVGEKHKIKADLADKHGIELLQFFEDEIIGQLPIVQSMIKDKYGICDNIIYGRKCEIKEVDSNTAKEFLLNNHLQGDCKSFYKIGLFYEEKLISLLSFRKYENSTVEIARYCTLINHKVNGGFAKLLSHAEKYLKSVGYKSIITFSNRRYSRGEIYKKNGFSFVKQTVPDFFWVKKGIRYDRHISWGKTKEQMIADKYYSILGAGNVLWSKDL